MSVGIRVRVRVRVRGGILPTHTIHTMHYRQSEDRVRGDLPTRIEAVSQ